MRTMFDICVVLVISFIVLFGLWTEQKRLFEFLKGI